MILLAGPERGRRPPFALAVFGAGLIGSAVAEAVAAHAQAAPGELPLLWGGRRWDEQLGAVEERLAALLTALPRGVLRVLWSAGRAGFAATDEEAAVELQSFRSVLEMTERLALRFPQGDAAFHLVSSAGGLFEGQRHVGPSSRPSPRRPYGRLKLRQEQLLQASDAPFARRIYRVTAVYGYLRPRQRLGLISTLLLNGVRRRVTRITGRMSTLRDFVFVADVAAHIARALVDERGPGERVALLAHAKPSSLFEVQGLIEGILGRKIYVSYSLDLDNSEDITFSPGALPAGWHPSDLGPNLARIYREAVASGALFGPPTPFASP